MNFGGCYVMAYHMTPYELPATKYMLPIVNRMQSTNLGARELVRHVTCTVS